MESRAAPTAVLCPIEVPQVVLGAVDADPSRHVPEPCASLAQCLELPPALRRMNFRVPEGCEADCLLRLPSPGGGDCLELALPHGLAAGDAASALQSADGRWRVVRRPDRFAFLPPEGCEAGETLRLQLPDGTFLGFEVPEEALGNLVELRREGEAWLLEQVCVLPEVGRTPKQSEVLRGPYAAALELLSTGGHLQGLPVDGEGMLQVNVPFCGRFQEYCLLGDFIAEHCLTLPGVRGARLLGVESLDSYYQEWAIAQQWFRRHHPGIEVHLLVRDLTEHPLPEAGLTIALHPEVTRGGGWFPIMGSVIRSARRGLCVIATFYEDEMRTALNMVDMYRTDGRTAKVVQNPYYERLPAGDAPPSERMRHLILLPPNAE
mmetsp:Transcript_101298/g.315717  ORF Transcript_101298/g.315717 Transcript_101298/m.315717 type:complete len:377 (+) Transcript_101298:22-1152(+)